MKIQHVAVEYVYQTWPLVEDFISWGLPHANGDYTLEQIKAFVSSGQWMLVVAVDGNDIRGAMTINFFNRPNDRVAFITTVGGKDIINDDTFAQLKNLVAAFGATYIEAAGRESVVKMLSQQGFKEKYRIVGVKL